jgi:hypothetical protein
MNAPETLQIARAAGITITVMSGKMTVHGVGEVPSALVESIRVNKLQIMALIQTAAAEEANKAREASTEDWMLPGTNPGLPEKMPYVAEPDREQLINQVVVQGQAATRWCMRRVNTYFEKFPHSDFRDQDVAAAMDFLREQARSAG